jgi:peptidoglycan/LPS O-acetylase OafA/YrhL
MITITSAKTKKHIYRPEIDGLRAIAVISVIIFHFSKSVLPSGFLGVDIFFVISGYVITSSLHSRSDYGFTAFMLEFYSRRIKRIMPALVFNIVASCLLISFFSPIANDSLKAGIFALFGLSNLYFIQTDLDYFGNTPELNIFTQTWSLGVEEQFYVIYPVIFWIFLNSSKSLWCSPNRFIVWLLGFVLCSLALFIVLTEYFPVVTFYLVFTRFWELGTGCLIALTEEKLKHILEKKGGILSRLLHPSLALGIIFVSLLFPADYIVFKTIAIVLATAVLITTVERDNLLKKILSSKIPVYIGTISFSLYLWHWTVLVTSNWTVGVTLETLPVQLVLIAAVSALSYHYIEQPIKKNNNISPSRIIAYGLGIGIVITTFIFGIYLAGGLYLGKRESDSSFTKSCQNSLSSAQWVVGDSHASIYAQLFSHIYKGDCVFISDVDATGNSFLFSRKASLQKNREAGSKPLVDVTLKDPSMIIEAIKKHKPKVLFIAIYWNGYFLDNSKLFQSTKWSIGSYVGADGVSLRREQALALYLENIRQLSEAVRSTTEVILLLPEPDFNWINVGVTRGECNQQWFMTIKYPPPLEKICASYLNPASISKQENDSRSAELVVAIKDSLEGVYNLRFFDITNIICVDDICSTHPNGLRHYMDDDHINSLALEKIKPFLLQTLQAVRQFDH